MHSASWSMLSLPIYSVALEITHSVSGKRMPWSWWECADLRTLIWVLGFHICPENLSFDGAHGIHMYASAFFVTHHMHYWKYFFCACERQNPWLCSLHGCIRTYPYYSDGHAWAHSVYQNQTAVLQYLNVDASLDTVKLQWLEHWCLVYHVWFKFVFETQGNPSVSSRI